MQTAPDLLPERVLRNAGPPTAVADFRGVQIDDALLSMVVSPDAPLLTLYEGTLHGEGPAWQVAHDRLVWSDVTNRRLLGWYPDGHIEVLIDGAWFTSWASCQHPLLSRTASLAARTDGGCSSPRHNICSRSILSVELMKMPVGVAQQRVGI